MKNILIYLIRVYQKYLSPLKSTKCPYIPSCSQYGLEAIQKYGAIKGSLLALWRIIRCNPFSKGGYDPDCRRLKEVYFGRRVIDTEQCVYYRRCG